jgi:hypothetical protein
MAKINHIWTQQDADRRYKYQDQQMNQFLSKCNGLLHCTCHCSSQRTLILCGYVLLQAPHPLACYHQHMCEQTEQMCQITRGRCEEMYLLEGVSP